MTIGIYRLIFPNTDKCYIGQSVNIERRYMQHLRSFELGTASTKLQNAYNVYGKPKLDILLDDIDLSELDSCENEAIEIFDSFNSGFNQLEYASDTPTYDCKGPRHCAAKYSEDIIIAILFDLATFKYTIKEIQVKYNTTVSTVQDIQQGYTHKWLAEKYPEVYKIVTSSTHRNQYATRGKPVPLVISPDNNVYEVPHLGNFCKQFNLVPSGLSSVINKTRKTHKGWRLHE